MTSLGLNGPDIVGKKIIGLVSKILAQINQIVLLITQIWVIKKKDVCENYNHVFLSNIAEIHASGIFSKLVKPF